jgi:hypothetical protein
MPKHHNIKTYGGVEGNIHALLTSALDADECLHLRSGRFIRRNNQDTSGAEEWKGSRDGLEMEEERKFPVPAGRQTLDVQHGTIHFTTDMFNVLEVRLSAL